MGLTLLALIAVVAAVMFVAATQAAAQAVDERAAARAFADAALRYRTALVALQPQLDALGDTDRRCADRARRRIAERHWDGVNLLVKAHDYRRPFARLVQPALTRLSGELHAVQTTDPALRAGRTAVRRARRVLAAVAALPPVDVCAEIRRWVTGGFEPTPMLVRVRRALTRSTRVIEGDELERRARRLAARLRQLGVPASEAAIFTGGDTDGTEGGR